MSRNRSGYVYLIKADTGDYKIGRSNNVPNRVRIFGIKLPFKIEVIHLFPCSDMIEAEKQLHIIFADKRLNGEWFNLSPEDVTIIKSIDQFNKLGEFEKLDTYGGAWGMPELWKHLPSNY